RTQKSHIFEPQLISYLCSYSHPVSFDINTDEIFVRKMLCKSDAIFTLTTSQFQYYRILISKKI
ncbi:hypothetical protein KBA84_06665, partial [Patescibacteria group bacterium]|nr:hypothetical protein [Patescibacteria group bacterium]